MQIMTRQRGAIVAIVGAQSGVSVSTIKGRLHQGLSISMGRDLNPIYVPDRAGVLSVL